MTGEGIGYRLHRGGVSTDDDVESHASLHWSHVLGTQHVARFPELQPYAEAH